MESGRRIANVGVKAFAVVVLLMVLTPAEGAISDDTVGAKPIVTIRWEDSGDAALVASSASCTCPCEATAPSPAAGATGVALDTQLSWKVPAPKGCDRFRMLASTGGIGADVNPFNLVELATDPVNEVPIGSAYSLGFVSSLDFSPDGLLYGSDGEFCIIDPGTGSTRTVCGSLSTADGRPVSLTGIAFHPNGTLYGIDWDMDTDDNVFYTIDLAQCTATEVCRIPSFAGSAWGIDFSPEGVLYGAFGELVKFDLAKGTATIVGRRFSLPFINDIDYAPDGFIYGVDNMQWRSIRSIPRPDWWSTTTDPITRSCGASPPSASRRPAPVGPPAHSFKRWRRLLRPECPCSADLPDGGSLSGMSWEPWRSAGLRLDRLAWRGGASDAEETPGRSATDDETSSLLYAAAAGGSSDVVCDVYLDTVNPPVKAVGRSVLPPVVGDVWTCNSRVLQPDLTYYWKVVVRNSCGVTKAGPVWSFKTNSLIFQDPFPSTTIDLAQWPVVKGATIDDTGQSETSPPYSLRLNAYPDGGDSVESRVIDLSSYAKITLSYCFQQGGGNDPDETDDLIFEYYSGDGWVELGRQLGADPAMTSFECVTTALPAEALTSQFKLRIRCVGTAPGPDGLSVNDDWFVDDVTLYSD